MCSSKCMAVVDERSRRLVPLLGCDSYRARARARWWASSAGGHASVTWKIPVYRRSHATPLRDSRLASLDRVGGHPLESLRRPHSRRHPGRIVPIAWRHPSHRQTASVAVPGEPRGSTPRPAAGGRVGHWGKYGTMGGEVHSSSGTITDRSAVVGGGE